MGEIGFAEFAWRGAAYLGLFQLNKAIPVSSKIVHVKVCVGRGHLLFFGGGRGGSSPGSVPG